MPQAVGSFACGAPWWSASPEVAQWQMAPLPKVAVCGVGSFRVAGEAGPTLFSFGGGWHAEPGLALGTLMALPLASACAVGWGSIALTFAHILDFKSLRALGHGYDEVIPSSPFHGVPVLRSGWIWT